ncbi:Fe2+-dependent dioxygenase [Rhodanobacter aciditrophus]|uniref:Fe2+-dependent dioxygenase n=1 Tax=Rhodanobacter aciditrophus TaxID=1623218 RepID=UPI003CEF7293
MIVCVPDVLTAQELGAIQAELQTAPFVDGSTTAGWSARGVKKNQQIDPSSASYERLAAVVRAAFQRHALLQASLLPAATTQPLFNRYAGGMEYGAHVDAPVMGGMGSAVRTDIAITVFLSDPRSYDGGELVTHASGGMEYNFKLDAGAAIAYPANTLHHVNPVTRGVRDAAIIWVQSLVRDPARRELLWDLESAKRDIFGREGKSQAFDAVSRSHANLLRMWAEVAG